jgi:8-oxo-dGTP pyrophosphatase MutT (NUDIX family)
VMNEILDQPGDSILTSHVRDPVRSLVTENANLRREVETWVARAIGGTDTIARERREHAAEIARLKSGPSGAWERLRSLTQDIHDGMSCDEESHYQVKDCTKCELGRALVAVSREPSAPSSAQPLTAERAREVADAMGPCCGVERDTIAQAILRAAAGELGRPAPSRGLVEALYQLRVTLETREQRDCLRAVERVVHGGESLPSPLTEAEAQAWAAVALHEVGRVSEWPALRCDLKPLRNALLAANRGEIPPEVRPSGSCGCNGPARLNIHGHHTRGSAGCDYVSRRDAGESGHGMCEPVDHAPNDEPDSVDPRDLPPDPPSGFKGCRGRVLGEAIDGAHVARLVEYVFPDGSRVPYTELHETHDGARPGRVISLSAIVHLAQNATDAEVWQIGNREPAAVVTEGAPDSVDPSDLPTCDACREVLGDDAQTTGEAMAVTLCGKCYRTAEEEVRAEPWRPKPGDRVRTAAKLTSARFHEDHPRKADCTGKVDRSLACGGAYAWMVRHDDGTEAPYDADELQPEPVTRLCVACLVTDPDGRVLMVRNRKRAWELPGGKVRDGEAPIDAIRREVREEAGLTVAWLYQTPTEIAGTPKPGASYTSRILVYEAHAEGTPTAGDDAVDAAWLTRSDVLDLHVVSDLSDLATRDVLLEWARGAQ